LAICQEQVREELTFRNSAQNQENSVTSVSTESAIQEAQKQTQQEMWAIEAKAIQRRKMTSAHAWVCVCAVVQVVGVEATS
jgi:hypothetical protein